MQTNSRRYLLILTLILNYCGSLYLTINNEIFGKFLSISTLFLSLLHAVLYFFKNRNSKRILKWLIIYIVLFIAYRVSARREVLDLFTYVSFYSSENLDEISIIIMKTAVCFMIIAFAFSLLKIIPTSPEFYRDGYRRFTFGLNHPNAGGHYCYLISCCIFVNERYSKSIRCIMAFLMLGIISLFVYNCRTSSFLIAIIIMVSFIKKVRLPAIKLVRNRIIKQMLYLFGIIMVGLSLIYISKNYHSFSFLNAILSARLENNNLFLNNYNITVFGNSNVATWLNMWEDHGPRYLDSGIMQLVLTFGIVNTISFFVIYSKSVLYNVRLQNSNVIICLLFIIMMLVVEASPLRWYFSWPIIFQKPFITSRIVKEV